MTFKKSLSLLAAITLLSSVATGHANTHLWSGAQSGYWSQAGNWSSGGTPWPGEPAPVVIQFPSAASALRQSTNDVANLNLDVMAFFGGNYRVSSLPQITFNGGTPPFPYAGNLSSGSGATNLIVRGTGFTLATNIGIAVGNGGLLELDASMSGAGGFTKTGGGILWLAPAWENDFAGAVNLLDGTLYTADRVFGFIDFIGTPVTTVPGDINIGDTNMNHSPTLQVQDFNQFGTHTALTINPNGKLELETETHVRSLNMTGGTVQFVPNEYMDFCAFFCGTNLTSNLTPLGTAAITGGGVVYFDVASNAFPAFVNVTGGSLLMDAELHGGATLIKTGAGQMILSQDDDRSAGSVIKQGTLTVSSANPFPWAGAQYTVAISNGAQVVVTGPCSPSAKFHLNGFGPLGIGGSLTIQHDNVHFTAPLFVDGDTAIYVSNVGDTASFGAGINGSSGNLTKKGLGTLQFTGSQASQFTNIVFADQGTLALATTSNVAAVNGPLVVGHNVADGTTAEVKMLNDAVLPTNCPVTINASGTLNLFGTYQGAGFITLMGGGIKTAAGALTLYSDVLATNGAGSIISGAVVLAGGKHAFHLAPNYGVNLTASLTDIGGNAGFDLDGGGSLTLSGVNTALFGPINVKAGLLYARNDFALGNGPGGINICAGARLAVDGRNLGTEPIFLSGDGNGYGALSCSKTNLINGPVTLVTNTVINVVNANDRLIFGNAVSGPGALTKIGAGALRFTGNVANTYAGGTTVSEGALELAKTNAIAVPGTLIIGDDVSAPGSHFVRLLASNQIADTAMVTVYASGVFDLTPFAGLTETIGMILGDGDLELGSSSLYVGAHNVSGVFSGSIGGTGVSSLVKSGKGMLTLNSVSGNWTGATIVNSGTLMLNGSQPSCSVTLNTDAKLAGNGTSGNVNSQGGMVSPGSAQPKFQFTCGNLALNSASTFTAQLNGTNPGVNYTCLNAHGTVNLGGAILNASLGFTGAVSNKFVLIDNDGNDPVTGTFNGLPEGGTFMLNGAQFQITYAGGTGNDVVLTQLSPSTAPSITGIQPANGQIQLSGTGIAGGYYLIQANIDLATTNWLWIGTSKADNSGAISFTDTNAVSFPVRFYRFLAQ